jgi:hypothetical protein
MRGRGAGATAAVRGCSAGATAVARGRGAWAVIAGRAADVRATVRGAGFALAFAFELNASAYQQRSDLLTRTV